MAKKVSSMSLVKKLLIVASALLSLFLIFVGVMVVKNYIAIQPYKKLATELNETLGGGYRISYNWNCGLETTNCPSARMIKDANFKDNEEAQALFLSYTDKMKANNYTTQGISICEPRAGFEVYCAMNAKKDNLSITINAKKDFIGIDIQP